MLRTLYWPRAIAITTRSPCSSARRRTSLRLAWRVSAGTSWSSSSSRNFHRSGAAGWWSMIDATLPTPVRIDRTVSSVTSGTTSTTSGPGPSGTSGGGAGGIAPIAFSGGPIWGAKSLIAGPSPGRSSRGAGRAQPIPGQGHSPAAGPIDRVPDSNRLHRRGWARRAPPLAAQYLQRRAGCRRRPAATCEASPAGVLPRQLYHPPATVTPPRRVPAPAPRRAEPEARAPRVPRPARGGESRPVRRHGPGTTVRSPRTPAAAGRSPW